LKEKVAAPIYKTKITVVGIRSANHSTLPYSQKLTLTSPTSGGRLVGIVCSRTKAKELLSAYIEPRLEPLNSKQHPHTKRFNINFISDIKSMPKFPNGSLPFWFLYLKLSKHFSCHPGFA
jgi:hypothetical protein